MYTQQKQPDDKRRAKSPARATPAGPVGDHASAAATPEGILALQRAVGNQAVARLLDEDQHVHGAGCGHGEPVAQRALIDDALGTPGRQIETSTREKLESFYQADLSGLRVHTGDIAQRSAADLGAHAYTVGTDIVLGAGAANNDAIIAHEAGHAVENMAGVVEKGTNRGDGVVVTDPGQDSEVTAAKNGDAFASGVEFAPSLTAQRAVTSAGAGGETTAQRAVTVQRGVMSKTEKHKSKKDKKKKDAAHSSNPHSPTHSLEGSESGGTTVEFASELPPNPTLYVDYGSEAQAYWVGGGGNPPTEMHYPVEQFCAYMSVYWLNHGHSSSGLRFAEFGNSRRMDGVNTLVGWAASGGRDGQTRYAVTKLSGSHQYSYAELSNAVNNGDLGHGTKIWFGNDYHAEAAYVRRDKKLRYTFDMYDPNTGKVTSRTAEQFLAYTASKNVFVVQNAH